MFTQRYNQFLREVHDLEIADSVVCKLAAGFDSMSRAVAKDTVRNYWLRACDTYEQLSPDEVNYLTLWHEDDIQPIYNVRKRYNFSRRYALSAVTEIFYRNADCNVGNGHTEVRFRDGAYAMSCEDGFRW